MITSYAFKYTDLVDWVDFKQITYKKLSTNAIHILEKNLDKVNWSKLSCNPNAIYILEKNLDKVDWYF